MAPGVPFILLLVLWHKDLLGFGKGSSKATLVTVAAWLAQRCLLCTPLADTVKFVNTDQGLIYRQKYALYLLPPAISPVTGEQCVADQNQECLSCLKVTVV